MLTLVTLVIFCAYARFGMSCKASFPAKHFSTVVTAIGAQIIMFVHMPLKVTSLNKFLGTNSAVIFVLLFMNGRHMVFQTLHILVRLAAMIA